MRSPSTQTRVPTIARVTPSLDALPSIVAWRSASVSSSVGTKMATVNDGLASKPFGEAHTHQRSEVERVKGIEPLLDRNV